MKFELLLNASQPLSEEERKLIDQLDNGDFEKPMTILSSTYQILNLSVTLDQSGKKYGIKATKALKHNFRGIYITECKNCKHDGKQMIFGAACTGCGVGDNGEPAYWRFEEK